MLEGQLASWGLLGRERPNRPMSNPGALDYVHWENGKSTSFPEENPEGYGKSSDLTNPYSSMEAFENVDCQVLPWSKSKPLWTEAWE